MINKVFLIGNLTKDPEVFNTKDGKTVCKAAIAVQRDFTNAYGQKDVDFFNTVIFGNKGDYVAKYIKKGNRIAIFGKLQNRSYEDKYGNNRIVTEIIVEEVQNLTSKTIEPESVTVIKKTRPELEEIDDDYLLF